MRLIANVAMALTTLAGAVTASAQERDSLVTVRVSVQAKSQPVGHARVEAGPVQGITSSRGDATLRLGRGTHLLITTRIGFEPDSLSLALGSADTTITIQLVAAVTELEELFVSSTRSGGRLEDEPLRVEVLAREEIEEKMLMTPGDISMLLNETGGMRVQNTNPSLGGANLRIQGLRGRYSLLLSDGLPLYGGQAGGLGLLQVPPMDLGQVEIIKGTASALYGSSALGGVVNLLSRPPDGDREALVNVTTLGGVDAIFWATGQPTERTGYTLLATADRQGRVDIDDDGWTDVPGYERVVVRPRLFLDNGSGGTLFITGGLTAESRDGGTMEGAVAPDGTPFPEALGTTRIDLGSVGRLPLTPGWLLTGRVSGMTQRHSHTFGPDLEDDRHSTAFAEAAVNRFTDRMTIVLGLAWQADGYRNEQLPDFDYTFTVPGLFAHAEWSPDKAFSAALSARLDVHSAYGTFLNPRASLLYRIQESWTLRASAGTGFYAPTPFTEETEVTGFSRLEPLSGVVAERARSASIDAGGRLGPFEVNATLFGSAIDGAVQQRPAATPGRFELFNSDGDTRAWGGELLARWRRGPVTVTGTYTYTEATEPDPDIPGARREVSLTPRHAVGVVGMWEREGRSRVGVELYYTGTQALDDDPYRTESVPYVLVGALAEHRIGACSIYINLENITNLRQTQFNPLVRPTRAPDGRWTTDAWAPLDGRVVNGGIRVEF